MSNDFDKAMKYFIGFSLCSAAILPIMFEVYANISTVISLFCVFCWAVFVGVKFSPLAVKTAAVGLTAFFFSSAVFSLIGYAVIHPAVKSWLEKNSTYFSLSLSEGFRYWELAFLILLVSYVVYFAGLGLKAAAGRLKQNSEETASAIDKAFEDSYSKRH